VKQEIRVTSRRGLSAVEYALLASLIAVGTIVALSQMSNQLSNQFNSIGTLIGGQTTAKPVPSKGGNSAFN
jgi:Flp pilus assembly pilin Flp